MAGGVALQKLQSDLDDVDRFATYWVRKHAPDIQCSPVRQPTPTSAAVVQGEPVPTAAGTPPDGRKALGIRRNSDADAGRPDTVW